MKAKSKWLMKKDGNIIIPKTLDTQVFDENGKSLDRRLKTAKDKQVIQLPKVDPTLIVSDLDYSTEEQLTGKRWTDGKPIYQKNIKGKINVLNNSVRTVLTDDNIDSLVSCTGHVNYEENDVISIPSAYFIPRFRTPDVTIECVQTGTTSRERDFEIIILYTKISDTASSPVAPPKFETMHNYSTEEKIVGTWIDGRPVYEKTIQISDTRITGDAFEIIFLENIDFLVHHSVMFKDIYQNGAKYILANYTGTASSWFSGNQMYITSNNDLVFRFDGAGGDLEIFGVIQYVKTTQKAKLKLIPTMTSDTQPYGIVSTNYTYPGRYAWYGLRHDYEPNLADGYSFYYFGEPSNDNYLQYDFKKISLVSEIKLKAWGNLSNNQLKISYINENNELIDINDSLSFVGQSNTFVDVSYSFNAHVNAKAIRITSKNGNAGLAIAQLQAYDTTNDTVSNKS